MKKAQEKYLKYPKRICRWLNSCDICKKDIVMGDAYRDGGYGRRAHENCVTALANPKTERTN